MNRTFQTVAVAMLLAGAAATPVLLQQEAQTKPKFAYIDSRTFAQTPERMAIAKQFETEMVPITARIKAMQDSDVAIIKKYNEDEPRLTPESKAARRKEIDDKRTIWRAKIDTLNTFADARGQELDRPTAELFKKILSDIRQEEGYWMILDVAGEGGLSIVAIDRNLDITDRVLSKYRVGAAALPKPAPIKIPPAAAGPVQGTTGVGRIPPPE